MTQIETSTGKFVEAQATELMLRAEVERLKLALREAICAAEKAEKSRVESAIELAHAKPDQSGHGLDASRELEEAIRQVRLLEGQMLEKDRLIEAARLENEFLMRSRSMRITKPLRDLTNFAYGLSAALSAALSALSAALSLALRQCRHRLSRWYSESRPRVSIIILNDNNAHQTLRCLDSIWPHTRGYRYEVIIVDNGSRPDDFQVLSELDWHYRLWRLEVSRSFGEANNIGAELAKGEFLLFMGCDVAVSPNWLSPLVNALIDHPECGAAGPKIIDPNGLPQETGVLPRESGSLAQVGESQGQDSPCLSRARAVDYVSATAVLVRKRTFEAVLGFDFIYEPAYYEDVDLCLKIGQLGLQTFYVPESCVVHDANATTPWPRHGLQQSHVAAVNRQKFAHRWSHFLSTGRHEGPPPAVAPPIRKTHGGGGPTAAFFTPYNIIPGGGERYLLTAVETMIQAGYHVWLVTPEQYSYLRLTKIAGILGLSLQGLAITSLKEAGALPRFDVFVAMGNEIAPPVMAMGRVNFYCCQFPFPCAQEEIDRRRGWMAQYDAIVVYSDFVKEHVLDRLSKHGLPNVEIHIVHPPVDMLSCGAGKSPARIVSVGRFFSEGHCKRQDMLIRAFRRLHESGGTGELHLAGSLTPELQNREYFVECQRLAQGLPVRFHVDAPQETLAALYASASVYWHGAGFGVDTAVEPEKCEHFGISVVEAMSAGAIPFVVNNGGPAATVRHGWNGFRYESEDELTELTRALFAQPGHVVDAMRGHARNRAMDFSKASFTERWRALLREFGAGTPFVSTTS